MARKNPQGAITAFRSAFPLDEDVILTVKARGLNDDGGRAWLAQQAEEDPRIRVIDQVLTGAEMDALMADCDVFLSLHRSEGFGFGCAQALALGKIVVSTDYGGTTDFVSETTGFPIAWTRVEVAAGEYAEAQGASWADPSIEDAADALQKIYTSPSDGRSRGIRGQAFLRDHHSPGVVGARLRDLLVARGLEMTARS